MGKNLLYAHHSAEHDLPRIDYDSITLRSGMTYNEIKYQVEGIPILCAVGTHGLQPEVQFSNFLAFQISNAVSQKLHSKHGQPMYYAS